MPPEEEKAIDFNFGEGTNEQETPAASVPKVGEIYQGCYVLAVHGNKVTLLSPSQTDNIDHSNVDQATLASRINKKLSTWEQSISTSWRLMNREEAEYIAKNYKIINSTEIENKLNGSKYYVTYNDEIYYSALSISSLELSKDFANYDKSIFLRPVTTITIQ